jgi:hypothetical protein
MLCIQVILAEFNITKVADVDKEWSRLKTARGVVFLEMNPELQDSETPAVLKAAKTILGFKEAAAAEPLDENTNDEVVGFSSRR